MRTKIADEFNIRRREVGVLLTYGKWDSCEGIERVPLEKPSRIDVPAAPSD